VPPFCGGTKHVNGSGGGDGQQTCYCARSNVSVGRMELRAPMKEELIPRGRQSALQIGEPIQQHGQTGRSLPVRCGYGFVPAKAGQCVTGPILKIITGLHFDNVAGQCCDACNDAPLGSCSGYSIYLQSGTGPGSLYRCDVQGASGNSNNIDNWNSSSTGTGSNSSSTNTSNSNGQHPGNQQCIHAAIRDPLPGGSWNWEVDLGGAWYSTTALGQCHSGQRPLDGSGCTWRLLQEQNASTFIESACLLRHVDTVVTEANQPCFTSCITPIAGALTGLSAAMSAADMESECYWRCYWLTVGGGGNPAVLSPSELVAPFLAAFADNGCPRLPLL